MDKALKLIGIGLLYVLAIFIVECAGFYHPFMWTYCAVFAAVLAAWPYYFLNKQYPMPGIAMLCVMLLLLFNFAIDEWHEYFAIGCLVLGFIAEGLRKYIGKYRSRKGVIASYAVMSLIPFTKSIVLWIDYETAMELVINRMGDIYAAVMGRMLSKYMLLAMIILTLIFAVVTMWLLTINWHPRDRYQIGYDSEQD